MKTMFERVSNSIEKGIGMNLTMDMTEMQIAELIYGEGPFAVSITKACPTSFFGCC